MNTRNLAALLSSLVAELLLLLAVIFPSTDTLYITNSSFNDYFSPLLLHFLSVSENIATLSLIPFSRKRKRTLFSEFDDPGGDGLTRFRFGELGRPDSFIRRNPDVFKKFFNLNSSSFDWLCGLLEPLLECRDPVDSPLNLSPETRLGIGLFRLATGANYTDVSSRFSVSVPVAKFCVRQLCRVLCTNYRFWVGLLNSGELESVSTRFESISGIPNCCGVICCVRFKVNEESIAAQLVADSSSRIISIIAGFRGNKTDFQVLESSTLFQDIENGTVLRNSQGLEINGVAVPKFLVGNGDYPLLNWLMLPFDDPVSQSNEENFNNAINLMRLPAVKAIESLRNWGVLSEPIEGKIRTVVASIGACSILHNMLLSREDYSAFCEDSNDYSFHKYQSSLTASDSVASAIRSALVTKAAEFQSQKQ
ncbi:protein ANTAGONIST OF LIKE HETEROCHROMATIN PROTEIN 1-like [Capsicum annuum]|uniref:protein ANTAGONIST OF LIKE HETEROCHROMATIN PROTEIN 1-like n=1 Tax=Capsicum annuum TaxID=4072 RepID=UPI001FB1259C|nr:protein ANTAGONIST OF LIKE HETEROCHROMATIN PROTEIN 1-like [Capsicum annuum]